MTEQEAIERLKCMRLFMQIEDDRNDCKFLEDDYIANDMAIKALEKQVAKKPKCFDDFEAFECPNCKGMIMALDDMSAHKHCLLCGQKLNWEGQVIT